MHTFTPFRTGTAFFSIALFMFSLIEPLALRAQNFLPDFTCSFANPDGASVIACGSVVTATVHYPESITHLTLTAPNSFTFNNLSGGADNQLRADSPRLGAAYI